MIRRGIVDGRLKPGQRLKEEELARDFGFSRTPVREALLILQTEGLVLSMRNRGSVVREYTASGLRDLYDLRAQLEGFAAHRAAQRVNDEQLERLKASNERFAGLSAEHDIQKVIEENLAFHATIIEAASCEGLAEMLRSTIQLPLVYRSYTWFSPGQVQLSLHYHNRIATAIEMGDGTRAEMIMREHVFEARDLLVSHADELNAGASAS